MNEFLQIAQAAAEAVQRGETAVVASIVRVRGSSPRHQGARMLIWPDGRLVGTIGGGTLEWRVIEHARTVLAERRSRLVNYVFDTHGGPDSVGLCGGSVDVHLDVALAEFAAAAAAAAEALAQGETVALASWVGAGPAGATRLLVWADGRTAGSLGGGAAEAQAVQAARQALQGAGASFVPLGGQTLHIDVLQPRPTLLIIGAGHVAQPLAAIGGLAGMRVCVVDDRAEWANRERFPTADEIAVVAYEPVHEILAPLPFPMTPATYVVVTTWGYDLPAMAQALQQAPAYIGLVASPTKTRVLFKRLREAGFPDEAVRRIRAPVGLDVGAENPGEIAVSILAEILAVRHGRSGQPLGQVRGARAAALFARPADLPAVVPAGLAEPR